MVDPQKNHLTRLVRVLQPTHNTRCEMQKNLKKWVSLGRYGWWLSRLGGWECACYIFAIVSPASCHLSHPLLMVQKSGVNSTVEVGSWNPIFYKVLAPAQVVVWDFFHQQYHPSTPPPKKQKNRSCGNWSHQGGRQRKWTTCHDCNAMKTTLNWN